MIHKLLLFAFVAVDCSAAELKPITQLQPDYSDVGPAYFVDQAEVQLVIAGDGVPFSLTSSIPLPDSVVRALSAWRYQPFGPPNRAMGAALAVPVRRAITPAILAQLSVRWTPAKETADALKRGESLSESTAAVLGARLPPNEEPELARTSLIVYYAKHPSAAATEARAALVLWMIEHYPQADILGSPYAVLNAAGPEASPEAAQKAKALWTAAISQYPTEYPVTKHAVNFLTVSDPASAANLLGKFPRLPRIRSAYGSVSGWRALGVNGVDLETGNPVASAGLAPGMIGELLKATDPEYVLSSARALTLGGRSLAKASALPTGYALACDQILAHVNQIYAETGFSCDTTLAPESPAPPPFLRARIGGKESQLTHRVAPQYPQAAKQNGISGAENFLALIAHDGHIRQLQLNKGVFALYPAAREAVLQWQYQPELLKGQPIEWETDITVTFALGR